MPVGDDWYLNLNSQKRPPGRNLGEHRLVRRSGATSRGTVVLVFCLHMRSFPKREVPTIFMGRSRLLLVTISKNNCSEIHISHGPGWAFSFSLLLWLLPHMRSHRQWQLKRQFAHSQFSILWKPHKIEYNFA